MDKRLILLNQNDNIVVVCARLEAGATLNLGGSSVVVAVTINIGHKLACVPIKRGEKVLKYGAMIGSASTDIGVGEHVHTHNMESDYIPTYTHDDDKSFVHY